MHTGDVIELLFYVVMILILLGWIGWQGNEIDILRRQLREKESK